MSKQKSETASLSKEELKGKIPQIQEQLFKLRIQKATGQLTNTASMKLARKELARTKTFLTQKESSNKKKKA